MIDAYTVGITFALQDGVSDGIAAIMQDLTALDRAVAVSAAGLGELVKLGGQLQVPNTVAPRVAVPSVAVSAGHDVPAPGVSDANVPPTNMITPPMTPVRSVEQSTSSLVPVPERLIEAAPMAPAPQAKIAIQAEAADRPLPAAAHTQATPTMPAAPIVKVAPAPQSTPWVPIAAPSNFVAPVPLARPSAPTTFPAPTMRPVIQVYAESPEAGEDLPRRVSAAPTQRPVTAPMPAPRYDAADASPDAIANEQTSVAQPDQQVSRASHQAKPPPDPHERAARPVIRHHVTSLPRVQASVAPTGSSGAAPLARPVRRWAEPAVAPAFAATAQQATSEATDMRQGTIILDGARLGRWMMDHMARQASRPANGMSGIDPRINATFPGAPSGW